MGRGGGERGRGGLVFLKVGVGCRLLISVCVFFCTGFGWGQRDVSISAPLSLSSSHLRLATLSLYPTSRARSSLGVVGNETDTPLSLRPDRPSNTSRQNPERRECGWSVAAPPSNTHKTVWDATKQREGGGGGRGRRPTKPRTREREREGTHRTQGRRTNTHWFGLDERNGATSTHTTKETRSSTRRRTHEQNTTDRERGRARQREREREALKHDTLLLLEQHQRVGGVWCPSVCAGCLLLLSLSRFSCQVGWVSVLSRPTVPSLFSDSVSRRREQV